MKRYSIICVIFAIFISLVGCSEPEVIISQENLSKSSVVHTDKISSDIEVNKEIKGKPIVSFTDTEEDVLVIDLENLYAEISNVLTTPESYIGKRVSIIGYLSKLDDGVLYYFIADDVCLGCDGESQWGHFIEMFNVNQLDLDDFWTDDLVTVEGIFDISFNEEGYEYPVLNIQSMHK